VRFELHTIAAMASIIHVEQLTKNYGDVHAVQGIDFDVQPGEIFAMLGPNGASKSTTVEILEGLRPRDGGEVSVLGIDPARDANKLKSRIGVVLQQTVFPGKIRVREAIELYGRLYQSSPNAKQLLDRFVLSEKANAFYSDLSGGQKQKLALILAMINDPPIVFLDEPTTGVDAHSRRAIHDWLREMRAEGRTVFLTTHYIHEAEQLADRVAILARGKVVRQGTVEQIGADTPVQSEIRVRTQRTLDREALLRLTGVAAADSTNGYASLSVLKPAETLTALVRYLDSQRNELLDITIRRPTLEDLFLRVTGERLTGEEES
jgi:ABC-2 type transport system ATP-binding protein